MRYFCDSLLRVYLFAFKITCFLWTVFLTLHPHYWNAIPARSLSEADDKDFLRVSTLLTYVRSWEHEVSVHPQRAVKVQDQCTETLSTEGSGQWYGLGWVCRAWSPYEHRLPGLYLGKCLHLPCFSLPSYRTNTMWTSTKGCYENKYAFK